VARKTGGLRRTAIVALVTLGGVFPGVLLSLGITTVFVHVAFGPDTCPDDTCIGAGLGVLTVFFLALTVFGIGGGLVGFIYGMSLVDRRRERGEQSN
jgi:hypothetical protein